MPIDAKVLGARELQDVARRFREAGRKDLTRELRRALDKAVEPTEQAIVVGLPHYLPDRYAAVLSKSLRFKTSMKTTGRDVSVRLVLTAHGVKTERQIRTLNNPGLLRHPVFPRGRRSTWNWVRRPQHVRAGLFDEPVEAQRHRIRSDVVHAMHNVAQKITKG